MATFLVTGSNRGIGLEFCRQLLERGDHPFALRLAIPAGTPGPFEVKNPRARGFNAPVRSRAADDEELLPLEQGVVQSDLASSDAIR